MTERDNFRHKWEDNIKVDLKEIHRRLVRIARNVVSVAESCELGNEFSGFVNNRYIFE